MTASRVTVGRPDPTTSGLLALDPGELMARARAIRDGATGPRVTYSPKVFIPLTTLCRDRCHYCTFAQPPARAAQPFLEPDDVLSIARAGADAGCHEALFTLGERPELRYPVAAEWLAHRGYDSTIGYLVAMGQLVLDETGLLPHANAGALHQEELARLREVAPSQGMMIETLRADLPAHHGSPDKTPERRLATLEAAGRLGIPFTTGILVGIGETAGDRLDALMAIAAIHARFGHIQEVIVQNFLPKPGTAMAGAPPCDQGAYIQAVALARVVLPPDVHVQAPPNLSDDFASLLDAGIDDWGGVSPVTADHVNPERPWPAVERLASVSGERGFELAPRLTVYPEFTGDRWLSPGTRFAVMDRADAEGLARDDVWYSGADTPAPSIIADSPSAELPLRRRPRGAVAEVLDGISRGETPGVDEIVTLFRARGDEVAEVARCADAVRAQDVGPAVTFVQNRNINYTNVCTFKCRFCGFSKGPLSLNLRGPPYLLTLDDIAERVVEAAEAGATEICLQGGIHPDFDGDYYLDVARAVAAAAPGIHIHGFTALEVWEGARRSGTSLADYLGELKEAGLRTLPGTAAEILDDDVRAVLCPDKITTDEWLEVHRVAHGLDLKSNVTIMFGAVEAPVSWARHIVRTRDLARATGGFTEFVPLPFVHMAAPIYLQRRARRGPTFREAVLMHAVGRLAYRGAIDNIQVSWVKMGRSGARQAMRAGANDLGGTLMDENISRAAGAVHGQGMDAATFEEWLDGLDRPLVQRSTLYDLVAP